MGIVPHNFMVFSEYLHVVTPGPHTHANSVQNNIILMTEDYTNLQLGRHIVVAVHKLLEDSLVVDCREAVEVDKVAVEDTGVDSLMII